MNRVSGEENVKLAVDIFWLVSQVWTSDEFQSYLRENSKDEEIGECHKVS